MYNISQATTVSDMRIDIMTFETAWYNSLRKTSRLSIHAGKLETCDVACNKVS